MLWVMVTLAAAAAQTARNAMQSSLTGSLGTLGATQVRFLFGLPFAICFLLVALTISGSSLSPLNERFLLHTLAGNTVAACRDIARATTLAAAVPKGKLDTILRQDLEVRQRSCREDQPARPGG